MLTAEHWDVLDRLVVTDARPEPVFAALLETAALALDVPVAAISVLDRHGTCFRSRTPDSVSITDRDLAFCNYTVAGGDLFVVPDAREDERFSSHVNVVGEASVRFYAGVSVELQGERLGTLHVYAAQPRSGLTPAQAKMLACMGATLEEALRLRFEAVTGAALMRRAATKSRKLLLAGALAGVGHWRLEVASGRVEWSEEVYRIHGLDSSTFDPALDDALQFYTEADRPKVAAHIDHSIRTGEGHAFKAVLKRASDGGLRKVMSRAEVETDESGRITAVFGVFQDITDQDRLLQQALDDSERYKLITQNATDVIAVYEPTCEFTYVSPAAQTIFGHTPDDLMGHTIYEIIHPEDRAAVRSQFDSLVANPAPGASIRSEYRVLRADGSVIWIEAHPRVIYDEAGGLKGFQDVLRDITARKTAEDEARRAAMAAELARATAAESERRYRLLAENATDMIWRLTPGGTIEYVTPSSERILGYSPEEMVGRCTADFTHPDDIAQMADQYTAYVGAGPDTGPIDTQFRAIRKDGKVIWLEGRPSVVFDVAGVATELHDVVRDITLRKELETELIAAREAAETGARTKSDFLANMSHELRTPLNCIVGFTGLIAASPELRPETRRRAELVKAASRSLVQIVNDILEFSKFEAEGVTLCVEPADMKDLLNGAVELVKDEADRKRLKLELRVERSGPPVLVDPSRIQQVVLNLIGNAIKFTHAGGVTVTLSDDSRGFIKVSVSDTGVGIQADRLEAIFDRFAQADPSTSRRFGGTGLGLAISRSIIDAMGGELAVESTEGVGSTFWFTLNPSIADAVSPQRRASSVEETTHLPCRLLLADDNDANRDLFCALMAGRGLEIFKASDGAEAVRLVQQQHFDVVLMDVQMPVMDGLEATRAIRALGYADLPIVALTANVMVSQVGLCRDAGMNDHLSKPYTPQEVMEVLGRWTLPDRKRAMQNEAQAMLEDRLEGLERSLGARALDSFLERLAEQLRGMTGVLVDPDAEASELARRAHTVRGLAGTLGFLGVANSYAVLEDACRRGDELAAFAAPALHATTESLADIALRRAAA